MLLLLPLSKQKVLLLVKLITTLLLIPTLFSLLPYRKLWYQNDNINSMKCIIGPTTPLQVPFTAENNSNSNSNYRGDLQQQQDKDDSSLSTIITDMSPYYGIWISIMPNYMRKCYIHHPSSSSQGTKLKLNRVIINGAWLECSSSSDEETMNFKYDYMTKSWCFIFSSSTSSSFADYDVMEFCSHGNDDTITSSAKALSPTSGLYTYQSNNNHHRQNQFKLSVTCSNPIHNNHNNNHHHQEEFYPSTIFLLLLNIALAFLYWDKRIDPSTICKHFTKIVINKEIWRSFTGALAHFEPMHLLFNMMTLQALGSTLEGKYIGSTPFLLDNICFIPLTTIVMIGMIHIVVKYTGNEQYKQTSSVGYSGVLFAWSVVSALESDVVCPIPFASDMCFHTYRLDVRFMVIKFNLGPFIQLLFMQLVIPRVSFIGHLSGIVCGFIFHWKILPKSIFWNPQVLISLILLLHWRFVHHGVILLPQLLQHNHRDYDTCSDIIESVRMKYLSWTKRLMICLSILSIWSFGIFSAMTLSQLLSCTMLILSIQSNMTQSMKNQASILWRGTIVSFILVLVTDAMIIPPWFLSQLIIHVNDLMRVILWKEPIIMMTRWVIHFIGLILASTSLLELDEIEAEPKIFSKVFGKVVGWSSEVYFADGAGTVTGTLAKSSSSFIPFGGSGHTLGSIIDEGTTIESPQRSRLVLQSETV